MTNEAIANKNFTPEIAASQRFLDAPDENSFADVFKIFTPQLVAFFRARGCKRMAEDLAQEVMLTVYRKAGQVRDRSLFRAWLFKIASNAACRHFAQRTREVPTVDVADIGEFLTETNSNPLGMA